jgi:hypothetical protein
MPNYVGISSADATRDTAGTGGITHVERRDSTKSDEGKVYIIKGHLLPPMSKRKNFQGSSRYFQRGELGLSDDWELAHLWPPRFGDESAAGILWAPKQMNQDFQNHGVEPWLQRLRISNPGASIEITAMAASWCPKFLTSKGNPDYKGAEFMKWVSYEISNCPTGTPSPAGGGPLLGSSILMQMEPMVPGQLPKVAHVEGDTLLSWQ